MNGFRHWLFALALTALSGCGGSDSGGPAATYSVGGSVSGLANSAAVVLLDNAGNALTVSSNTTFMFTTPIASGAAYAVTVGTQPTGQTCTIANGSGTMGSANVTDVAVSCEINIDTFTVGGTVSGLAGTVVLTDNGSDAKTITANGTFTFTSVLMVGQAYAVTVTTQPAGQTCTVANGSGTVSTANVTGVTVTCANNASSFSVGGSVSGLASGVTVALGNNGASTTVSSNGSFTFPTTLAAGSAYSVVVSTQPAGETCLVTNGAGTIASANVTNVAVACAATSPPPASGTPSATFSSSKADATNLSTLILPAANSLVQAAASGGVPLAVFITPPTGITESVNCTLSGSFSEVINFTGSSPGLAAGDSATLTFNNCSDTAGETINGTATVTWTSYTSPNDFVISYVATNLTLVYPTLTYGPISYTGTLTDNNGAVSWTYNVDGSTINGTPIVASGNGTETITSGSINLNYGSSGWVSVAFSNWSYNLSTGVPNPGGTCTITGSNGDSAVVTVTSTGYNVVLTTSGGSATYSIPF